MRRVSLAIAVVGLNLMACCCGGVGPPAKKPNAQAVAEEPGFDGPGEAKGKKPNGKAPAEGPAFKGPGNVVANPAAVAAYDEFPEPHKSQLIKDWKRELEAARRAVAADQAARNRATTVAEREKYGKYIAIDTGWLERLQTNDPAYVTKATADAAAKYRETTAEKEIADARSKRKAKAEADARAKDEANRKAYESNVENAKAAHEKDKEKFEADKEVFDKSVKAFEVAKAKHKVAYDRAMKTYDEAVAEREAAKELNLARALNNGKTVDAATRRFLKIMDKYPGTQAARDAKTLLDGGYAVERKVPPEPGLALPKKPRAPVPPAEPQLVLPSRPRPVEVVYPPDPISQALADAALKAEAAMDSDTAARRAADDKYASALRAAEAEAARRAEEEYQVGSLVLFRKTEKGVYDRFSGYITGTVENRSDRKLGFVEIRYNLYDENDAQVGTASDHIIDLEPGGRWSFKAVTFNNRWKKYKCIKLSGF